MEAKKLLIFIFILGILPGCLNIGNAIEFSQVTHIGAIPFMTKLNSSTSKNFDGVCIEPLLLNAENKHLEWTGVPVTFDIEIYTVKNDIKDKLVYKKDGIIVNSMNDNSFETSGIFTSFADMDVPRGSSKFGMLIITAHLPDGRTLTGASGDIALFP